MKHPVKDFKKIKSIELNKEYDPPVNLSKPFNCTTLNKDQQSFFDRFIADVESGTARYEHQYYVLTGSAGNGKTYLTTQIIHALIQKGYKVHFSTFINRLVTSVSSRFDWDAPEQELTYATNHSSLGVTLKYDFESNDFVYQEGTANSGMLKSDVWIIDEAQMVDEYIFYKISKYFKDKVILFVGDKDQVPPVRKNEGNSYRPGPVFHDEFISLYNPVFTRLNINMRQGDSPILRFATNVLNRKTSINPDSDSDKKFNIPVSKKENISYIVDWSAKFFKGLMAKTADFTPHFCIICYTNKTAKFFNEQIRRKIYGRVNETPEINETVSVANPVFKFLYDEDGEIKEEKILDTEDVIKVKGIKYITNKQIHGVTIPDGYDITYYEIDYGSLDRVRVLTPQSVKPFKQLLKDLTNALRSLQEGDKSYQLIETSRKILKYSFTNINYLYARTIHKTVGSSIDFVISDITDLKIYHDTGFLPYYPYLRLLYTMISRARNGQICLVNE